MTATLGAPAVTAASRVRALTHHRAFVPLAAAILGLTISLIGIGIPSVWYDEAATITSATRTLPQLWQELGNVDAVHGLYYLLMHAVFTVFGYSPLSLRMPSALAVAAAASLVVILGRQLTRPRLGWIAALIFCLIPRTTWMGTEGRSYALTAALAILSTVLLLHAQKADSVRWWMAYGAVAVLNVTLFIYLALVIVAHGLTVLWLATRRYPQSAHNLRWWLLAAGVAGAACLPFAGETMSQTGQVAWLSPIGLATIPQLVQEQWFMGSLPFAILGWLLIVIGVMRMWRRPRHLVALSTILPALLVPTVGLLLISIAYEPIYFPRYLSMCTPFVALSMAAGIDAIRWRHAAPAAIGLAVLLAIPQIVEQRSPEAKENSSWSQVAELISSERASDGPDTSTAIVYGNLQRHPGATSRVMAYAYPQAFAGTIDPTLVTPAAETGELWEIRAPLADSLTRLQGVDVTYLITSNARDLRAATTATLEAHGWHLAQSWDFTAVHVLRYERN